MAWQDDWYQRRRAVQCLGDLRHHGCCCHRGGWACRPAPGCCRNDQPLGAPQENQDGLEPQGVGHQLAVAAIRRVVPQLRQDGAHQDEQEHPGVKELQDAWVEDDPPIQVSPAAVGAARLCSPEIWVGVATVMVPKDECPHWAPGGWERCCAVWLLEQVQRGVPVERSDGLLSGWVPEPLSVVGWVAAERPNDAQQVLKQAADEQSSAGERPVFEASLSGEVQPAGPQVWLA